MAVVVQDEGLENKQAQLPGRRVGTVQHREKSDGNAYGAGQSCTRQRNDRVDVAVVVQDEGLEIKQAQLPGRRVRTVQQPGFSVMNPHRHPMRIVLVD